VCLAGIGLALAMQRWGYPALRREVERRWGASGTPAEAGAEPALAE